MIHDKKYDYDEIEKKLERPRKKRAKMKVSGKSVFTLAKAARKQKKR